MKELQSQIMAAGSGSISGSAYPVGTGEGAQAGKQSRYRHDPYGNGQSTDGSGGAPG